MRPVLRIVVAYVPRSRDVARSMLRRDTMSVRIESRSEASATVVSIAGRLLSTGAAELLRVCASVEGDLVLDLSSLRSADPEGIETIRHLVHQGAALRGESPFIRLLLKLE